MSAYKKGDTVRQTVAVHDHPAGKEWEIDNPLPSGGYDVIVRNPRDGHYAFKVDEIEPVQPEPKFEIGDTVKVEFEGKVTFVHDDGYLTLNDDTGPGEIINPEHAVKVEPPVTVFKPGDRLRRKGFSIPYEITVADDGYLQHFDDGVVRWVGSARETFTSADYEKIEFARVPF